MGAEKPVAAGSAPVQAVVSARNCQGMGVGEEETVYRRPEEIPVGEVQHRLISEPSRMFFHAKSGMAVSTPWKQKS